MNKNRLFFSARTVVLITALVLLSVFSEVDARGKATVAETSTVVLNGIRESVYGRPIATDPIGDLAGEPGDINSGPAGWDGTEWSDLSAFYCANDGTNLFLYVDLPAYRQDTSSGQIGVLLQTGDSTGGTEDPWGNAILFAHDPLPTYVIRGNIPGIKVEEDPTLDNGRTVLARHGRLFWNDLDINWGGLNPDEQIGSHIAYADENGVEFMVPFVDVGIVQATTIKLAVFVTEHGPAKGAYDTLPTDVQSGGWEGEVELSAWAECKLQPPSPTVTPTVTQTPPQPSATPPATATSQLQNEETPSLQIAPAAVAAGGQMRISGYDFQPGQTLDIYLEGNGIETVKLTSVATGRLGAFAPTEVLLPPGLAPNSYTIFAAYAPDEFAQDIDVQILPPLDVTLSPSSAPVGTEVSITIDHLLAGSLLVQFGDIAVLGPLPVESSGFQGKFTVPALPGEDVNIHILNRVGDLLVNKGESTFKVSAGELQPYYELGALQISATELAFGASFQITGQISPSPSAADRQAMKLAPLWQAGERVFPLATDNIEITASGQFAIDARLPDLYAGDPLPAQSGDSVGVSLVTPHQEPLIVFQVGPKPKNGTPLLLNVLATDTGKTLSGAKVWAVPLDEQKVIAIQSGLLVDQEIEKTNQVNSGLITGLTPEEIAKVKIARGACPLIGVPVADQSLVMIDPAKQPWLDFTQFPSFLRNDATKISVGNLSASTATVKGTEEALSSVSQYSIFIDALAQGYGKNNLPQTVWFDVFYDSDTDVYLDEQGNKLSNPLDVYLEPLTIDTISPLGKLKLSFVGLPQDATAAQGVAEGTTFGIYYSTALLPPAVQVSPQTTSVAVRLALTPAEQKLLTGEGMKLYLDGKLVDTFDIGFDPNVRCDLLKGPHTEGYPFYQGTAALTNLHQRQPKIYDVRVDVFTTQGMFPYSYKLKIEAVPDWIGKGTYKTRQVSWQPAQVFLLAKQVDGMNEAVELAANLKFFNNVTNRAGLNLSVSQTLYADGSQSPIQTLGGTQAMVWNKQMPTLKIAPAQVVNSSLVEPSDIVIHVDETFNAPDVPPNDSGITIGIPVLANIRLGIRTFYDAMLRFFGTITIAGLSSEPQFDLTVQPKASAGVEPYVDGTLLGDLAVDIGTYTTGKIGVSMPVQFTNAGIDSKGICFQWHVTWTWYVRALCTPKLCGGPLGCIEPKCLIDESDTEDLLGPDYTPKSNNSACKPALVQASAIDANAQIPEIPYMFPAMATDGYGNTMAIWRTSEFNIVTSSYQNGVWSEAVALVETDEAMTLPTLAYYAPNRAVAVWVASRAAEQPQDPTLAGAIASYRLVYSLWDGATWSNAQELTTAGSGDGRVVLAGCIEPDTACAAGGEVTALWVRNMGADAAQHDYALYSATFVNGSWSSPALVEDNAGGTDHQPMLVYQNGIPVAAWVRDADRDFTTLFDRRIFSKALAGPAQAVAPEQLPLGVLTGSMDVLASGERVFALTVTAGEEQIGTAGELHVAVESCTRQICNFKVVKVTDSHNRTIRLDRSQIVVDPQDHISVVLRGLGFGPDQNGKHFVLASDPIGMQHRSGELIQVHYNGQSPVVGLQHLTTNGAVNWQPAAVYDANSGNILSLAVHVPEAAPPISVAAAQQSAPHVDAPDALLHFAQQSQLPDFAVESAMLIESDGKLFAQTTLVNAGVPWRTEQAAESGETPKVHVFSQSRSSRDEPLGFVELDSFETGVTTVLIPLSLQAEDLIQMETFAVVINFDQAIQEADGRNNRTVIETKGLASPNDLIALQRTNNPVVHLSWNSSEEPLIVGYRIYRAQNGEAARPIGSSFEAGFVDLQVAPGQRYEYWVTGFTQSGTESARSHSVIMETGEKKSSPSIYLPFITNS